MNNPDLYERCLGHFVDVRLKDEDEFIKAVFVRSLSTDHGQISRSFIYADIVPDGNEDLYLNTYTKDPDAFQRIPLPESQIAEVKIGNRISL